MSAGTRTTTQWLVTYERTFSGEPNFHDDLGRYVVKYRKTRGTEKMARGLVVLLGPEPWLAYGKGPADPACECKSYSDAEGADCPDCEHTMRSKSDARRKDLPPAENIKLYKRKVTRGPWEAA